MSVEILALALLFGFIPFLIFLCILVMALFRVGHSRKASAMRQEEIAVMRDIQEGLVRLEQRVDALETLLEGTRPSMRANRTGEH